MQHEVPALPEYNEGQLIHFGNFLFKKYGTVVFSNDGKNEPIYERRVTHADLCNWKDLARPLQEKSNFSHGDKVRVFLMPEGEGEFPGFVGYIVSIHDHVGKRKYDVELYFEGGFKTRIYNVDDVLITPHK